MAPHPFKLRGKKRSSNFLPPAFKRPKRTREATKAGLGTIPTEILVRILHMSMNFNLSFVNKRFYLTLNSEREFQTLVYDLFSPTWDHYQMHRVGDALFPNAARNAELAKVQSMVLREPWLSVDLILKAHEDWVKKQDRKMLPAVHQDCEGSYPACPSYCGPANNAHIFEPTSCFEHDYQRAKTLADNDNQTGLKDIRNHQVVEPMTQIPLRLLVAPFHEKRVKLLFWLITGGAYNPYAVLAPTTNWDSSEHLEILSSHALQPTPFFVKYISYICDPQRIPARGGCKFYLDLVRNAKAKCGTAEGELLEEFIRLSSTDTLDKDDLQEMRDVRKEAERSEPNYDIANDSDVDSDDLDYEAGARRYQNRGDDEGLRRWNEMHEIRNTEDWDSGK